MPRGKRPLRLVLMGLFGGDNYGNDASLASMIGFLRRACPEAELTTICINPAKVEEVHGIPGIMINWPGFSNKFLEFLDLRLKKLPRRLMNVARTMREIRRFDALIVPGTGVLSDYRTGPFGVPYWIFRWFVAARLFGVRIHLVCIGAGPIECSLSRWMLKHAARAATYRSFRDEPSRSYIADLGIDTTGDHVYQDIVFRLPFPESSRVPDPGVPATVGVGLMSYNGWQGHASRDETVYETYLAKLVQFVCWLLDRGHPVRLLVGEITDVAVVEELRARVHRARGMTDMMTSEASHSPQDILRQIARTDIVVATRFHNVISALKLGRPTISISYARRNDGVMRAAGLEGFYQPVEQLSMQWLTGQFQEMAGRWSFYHCRVIERVAEFQNRLDQQDRILLASIRESQRN